MCERAAALPEIAGAYSSSSGQKSTNVHKMSLKEEKAIFYSALLLNLEEGETEKMPGKHSLVLTLPITGAPEKQQLALHYKLTPGSGQLLTMHCPWFGSGNWK